MQYAFMTFSTPKHTLADLLALAKRLGYAGVEPRLGSSHGHGIETTLDASARQAVRQQVEASGVKLACLASSAAFADPAVASQSVDLARAEIDLAADVGCRRLRIFGGHFAESLTRDEAVNNVVTSLRDLAPHAAKRDVTLCLETHDAWCNPHDVAAVMQAVGHDAVAVNWDVLHTQRVGGMTPEQALDRLRPWVRHVHVHDGPCRGDKLILEPIGRGDIDHARVLRVLRQGGYDGFISGEWIAGLMSDAFPDNYLETELAALRRLEEAA